MKTRIITTAFTMLFPLTAMAQAWHLDPDRSLISYVSVKNGDIIEVNRFPALSGNISNEGRAEVVIDMASVSTDIQIRDERLQQYLFKTREHPAAVVTANLDISMFENMSEGDITPVMFDVTLSLVGMEADYTAEALLSWTDQGRVSVSSRTPIIVEGTDFEFGSGLATLQELAGLESITPAVPVNFTLVFERE